MKDIKFTLSGTSLWICDMRPGLTQDGTSIELPAGEYRCRLTKAASGLSGFEYMIVGREPSQEERVGGFSVDMARVGVVEIAPLLAAHDEDWEALSDWSEEAADQHPTSWGGRLVPGTSHAVFFDVGGDCDVEVLRVLEGRDTVGLRVRPIEHASKPEKHRKWTWVEVKVRGFGDTWSFCDDWDYDPEDDLIYDDIESGLNWEVNVSENTVTPLHELCPKVKGIATIKVYTEEAFGQEAQPRKKLRIEIPSFPEYPTAEQLREVILKLFIDARKQPSARRGELLS